MAYRRRRSYGLQSNDNIEFLMTRSSSKGNFKTVMRATAKVGVDVGKAPPKFLCQKGLAAEIWWRWKMSKLLSCGTRLSVHNMASCGDYVPHFQAARYLAGTA
jgi:hypothetical protein